MATAKLVSEIRRVILILSAAGIVSGSWESPMGPDEIGRWYKCRDV